MNVSYNNDGEESKNPFKPKSGLYSYDDLVDSPSD